MDYPANNTKIKVENKNEDIVSFTQTSDTGGTITALKAGTAKLIVNGNNVVITVEEDTASTTTEATQTTEASASTTTTTTTQTSPVSSGEGVHYLFIRNLTLTVDGTTDYGLGLDPPKAGEYTIKAEDESILKIEDYGTGKG